MPRSMQTYVQSDNEVFDKEVEEWEAKQRRMDTATDEGEISSS